MLRNRFALHRLDCEIAGMVSQCDDDRQTAATDGWSRLRGMIDASQMAWWTARSITYRFLALDDAQFSGTLFRKKMRVGTYF
jgi:hypothetical protein